MISFKPKQINSARIAKADGLFSQPGEPLSAEEKRVLLAIIHVFQEKDGWDEFSYGSYLRNPRAQFGDEVIIENRFVKARGWLVDRQGDGHYRETEEFIRVLSPYARVS